MPNTPSARKRLRQASKKRMHNRKVKSAIRTRTRRLLEMESPEGAQDALSELYAMLDRAAAGRVLHPNTAARKKARLARHVERLSL